MKISRSAAALLAWAGCCLAGKTCVHPSKTYARCQELTKNPLDGCPPGTIYVSQSGAAAAFRTISDAVRSLPNDTSRQVILIGAGTYYEQINVTRQAPLTLLGQSNLPARGQPYSQVGAANTTAANLVQVYHNAANNATYPDNLLTTVLAVGPTYNATITGAGPQGYPVDPSTPFGSPDFRAYNIDFRNEFLPRSSGPALALSVGYANTAFYSCGFYSWQDTIFVGKLANALMHDAIVAGQTDFLYGFGTLWVSRSTLLLRNCGGGLTAWKGTNTSFANKYGVYVSSSRVLAANTTVAPSIRNKCSLGRPWNALHRSLFAHTYLDPSILPAGYTKWAGASYNDNFDVNTTMAVYGNYGPGSNLTAEARSNVTLVWDRRRAGPYLSPEDVFMTPEGKQPNVGWIDPIAL